MATKNEMVITFNADGTFQNVDKNFVLFKGGYKTCYIRVRVPKELVIMNNLKRTRVTYMCKYIENNVEKTTRVFNMEGEPEKDGKFYEFRTAMPPQFLAFYGVGVSSPKLILNVIQSDVTVEPNVIVKVITSAEIAFDVNESEALNCVPLEPTVDYTDPTNQVFGFINLVKSGRYTFNNLEMMVETPINSLGETPNLDGFIEDVSKKKDLPIANFEGSLYQTIYKDKSVHKFQLVVGFVNGAESKEKAVYYRVYNNALIDNAWEKVTNKAETDVIIAELQQAQQDIIDIRADIEELNTSAFLNLERFDLETRIDDLDNTPDKNGYIPNVQSTSTQPVANLPETNFIGAVFQTCQFRDNVLIGKYQIAYGITAVGARPYKHRNIYLRVLSRGGDVAPEWIKLANMEDLARYDVLFDKVKVIYLQNVVVGEPMTLFPNEIEDMFAEYPPIILANIGNYRATLFRFDNERTGNKVYYSAVMFYNDRKYFVSLVADKSTNTAIVESKDEPISSSININGVRQDVVNFTSDPQTQINTLNTNKAEKTYVDTELGKKADLTYTNEKLATKQDNLVPNNFSISAYKGGSDIIVQGEKIDAKYGKVYTWNIQRGDVADIYGLFNNLYLILDNDNKNYQYVQIPIYDYATTPNINNEWVMEFIGGTTEPAQCSYLIAEKIGLGGQNKTWGLKFYYITYNYNGNDSTYKSASLYEQYYICKDYPVANERDIFSPYNAIGQEGTNGFWSNINAPKEFLYQFKLNAGEGIKIDENTNTISAIGGTGGGTVVNVGGVAQSSIDFTSDPQEQINVIDNNLQDLDATKADASITPIIIDLGIKTLTPNTQFDVDIPKLINDLSYVLKVMDNATGNIRFFARVNSTSDKGIIDFVETDKSKNDKEPCLCEISINTATHKATYSEVLLQQRLSQIDLDNIASIEKLSSVTINGVPQEKVEFATDPQTQINLLDENVKNLIKRKDVEFGGVGQTEPSTELRVGGVFFELVDETEQAYVQEEKKPEYKDIKTGQISII